MAIITLTSDMGLKDSYVAGVKGAIYSLIPDVTIVDITHNIKPFDIAHASFVIRNVYKEFPSRTVHIVAVNPEKIPADNGLKLVPVRHLIVQYDNYYFIGADNGIFSLIMDNKPQCIFEINDADKGYHNPFPTKNVFTKAACHLISGGSPNEIATETDYFKDRALFKPVAEKNLIKGQAIYIDSYGNIISNIHISLFEEVGKNKPFIIFFRDADYDISEIHNAYHEVVEGEKLALFNSDGFLEIAINKGHADSLMGFKQNDTIRIEFKDT